jgi:hypothetical protein
VGDVAATGTPGVKARLELRGHLVELDQLQEDRAPFADRRRVIEHAGLSLQQRLLELNVLAQVEEGPAPVASTHWSTALGKSSTM